MTCCNEAEFNLNEKQIKKLEKKNKERRTLLKGMAAGAAIATSGFGASSVFAANTKLKLAFCGQLLCVIPYEVTRGQGHFADQGLDVELVYTRGGGNALKALIGGAVDYAGTSLDAVLQATKKGAKITRFASTGRLPLFALAVSPKQKNNIKSIKDLEGKTVGVSKIGNSDHALLLYLLSEAKADFKKVSFAALGPNLFDTLRLGQVDAGMVQEPALTLIKNAGGVELVNFMNIDQAKQYLGGAYEFMGVSIRAEERDQRLQEMKKISIALKNGLKDVRTMSPEKIFASLPKNLIAGANIPQLYKILTTYRGSLYPEEVKINMRAVERVEKAHIKANILKPGAVDLNLLMDTSING
jgi:NitT/TauT family transport system substrate-binding protein|tara:strand:+ start:144 stop:1211 length:1068 start_codon:yes stop_codon:yes gene_type:complete